MRIRFALGLLVAVAACGESEGGSNEPIFVPNVAYDTIAVIGDLDETNPLFVYRQAFPLLLDDSTVAYSEGRGGRMVVVNLLSGEGWEIVSGEGADGPGELNGQMAMIFTRGDIIDVVTVEGVYDSWTRDGELLSSRRHRELMGIHRADEQEMIVGVVGGYLVKTYAERPKRVEGEHAARQGIRIYDLDGGGLVADVSDDIPDLVRVMEDQGGGAVGWSSVSGGGLMVGGRGETVVWGMYDQLRVTTLDPYGGVLASRELESGVRAIFIDANNRVWARLRARDADGRQGYLVMDRELNELFRVAAWNIHDAKDKAMVTFQPGELGTIRLVLLWIREQ